MKLFKQIVFHHLKSKNCEANDLTSFRIQISVPCLYNAVLDLRKNLWQVFASPLFEYSLPLYFSEETATKKTRTWTNYQRIIKKIYGTGQAADTELINDLMRYNLKDKSALIQYISEKKWEYRKMVKDTKLRP